jgi:hypothetical protein
MTKLCPKCHKKRCSFGYPDKTPVICCDCVTDPKMINLYVNKCIVYNCTIAASYGLPNTPNRIHCQVHAVEGESLITGSICNKCPTRATYGNNKSKSPIHCSKHAEKGEYRLINKRLCACGNTAYYRNKYVIGQPALLKRATHCSKCKTPDMESTIHNTCIVEKCNIKKEFIKGISCDFCSYHAQHKDIMHCAQENCKTLIISSEDKCIRHRSGRYGDSTKITISLKTALKYYLEQL